MSRRIQTHEQCLHHFAAELKREIKSNAGIWRSLEPQVAAGRRAAFCSVVFVLKQQLQAHGIPLADVGLVDYEVPGLPE